MSPVSSLDSAVDSATIAIVLLALYYIVRQRLNRVFDAKLVLVAVYVAFLGGMLLELLRDFTSNDLLVEDYTFAEVGLILTVVFLLTGVAYTFSSRPPQPRFTERLRGLLAGRSGAHRILLLLIGGYFVLLAAYLVVAKPFSIVEVQIAGSTIAAPRFSDLYLALLSVVMLVYLVYPLPLFLRGALKAQNSEVRRALWVLPTSWIAVGAILLVFNGLLPEANLDLVVVGHLAIGAIFAITAVVFRNVDLLGTIFAPMESVIPVNVPVFSGALGIQASTISGAAILLEVDPSSNYERAVKDFIMEQLSRKSQVYVFTTSASPVMIATSNLPGVRFFVLTDAVSYAEPTDVQNRLLVPQGQPEVIVDVMERITAQHQESEKSVVFDNISEIAFAAGEVRTIKFLRGALAAFSEENVSSLFLITAKAHSPEVTLSVKRLFRFLLSYDSKGLHDTGTTTRQLDPSESAARSERS